MTDQPLLSLDAARISFFTRAGETSVIPGLTLAIRPCEAFGLVGESGSGKSTVALAIMRYLGRNGRLTGGRILFEGTDIATLDAAGLRAMRGRRIAMVYQDPMSSLNPVMTIGRQLMEVPILHDRITAAEARARALAMLREVRLPDPDSLFDRFPHQLSGGQQQRVVIGMALIARPSLLIMDEPTTGLDVTVEAAILDLVRALRRLHDTALLFISHNLGTVAQVCDRVGVMYGGELVEQGPVRAVFARPAHPYTRGLLDCLPTAGGDKHAFPLRPIPGQAASFIGARPPGCVFSARCPHAAPGLCTEHPIPPLAIAPDHEARCIRIAELGPWQRPPPAVPTGRTVAATPILTIAALGKAYTTTGIFGAAAPGIIALQDIRLEVPRGQTLAIVGESGCGKSTLARILAGLQTATGGAARLEENDLASTPIERRPPSLRRRLQMVFQNPDSTLNPSHSVGFTLRRAVRRLSGLSVADARVRVAALLAAVELPATFGRRLPHQLSGGQKQRVAIARALAGDPDILLADEPVSALDVSVQAAVINLLASLQETRAATLILISHDLAVVRHLADHVAVMYLGRIVESGSAARVFSPPWHPYTEALLAAAPDPGVNRPPVVLGGQMPSALSRPKGCVFSTRCPHRLGPICDQTEPPEQHHDGHVLACHIPLEALAIKQLPQTSTRKVATSTI